MRRLLILTLIAIVVVGALLWLRVFSNPVKETVSANVEGEPVEVSGFKRAEGPQPFSFPADFGPHPDYRTEWWYYTGNLETKDGRHFGYQLTFFRSALVPQALVPPRPSEWATSQVYMAHFALTDVEAGEFHAYERFERGAAGLAGAQAEPYRVWLDDWEVSQVDEGGYRVYASQDGITVDLTLTDEKGPIPQGDQGYSQKGPEPGDASYYYSQTRLVSQGSVEVSGNTFQVNGLSWMDHEYSTSALSTGQVGWDWFAIQLDNGSDLMVYQLRREDGSVDPFSSGTLIRPDGSTLHLDSTDFKLLPEGTWLSPHLGAEYPAGWVVDVPGLGLRLNVRPLLSDQELNLSFIYWEGAVTISGEINGQVITGQGYLEMTGYAGSMAGKF